ncbi:uncharacterized protein HMPREF1541_03574 [Cyphellophora europaea CBS 101466]|uniref:Uncharacterized protein n=1 Tax=Cyphellophora europaea (strain CBS 101466) TaxID=1220924 RepID=W2S0R6_CYPE1|nr:uncharacterized protein HMPREF1541_03574 [Cyphellophora europaea CBS 101466]ETN41638.1 hypothetical protein HMPREF1541_03574 [Cyphellophora europaea CBS 101466]
MNYMLTLMGAESGKLPLYIAALVQLVRDMKLNKKTFTVEKFGKEINEFGLSEAQRHALALRMNLLRS